VIFLSQHILSKISSTQDAILPKAPLKYPELLAGAIAVTSYVGAQGLGGPEVECCRWASSNACRPRPSHPQGMEEEAAAEVMVVAATTTDTIAATTEATTDAMTDAMTGDMIAEMTEVTTVGMIGDTNAEVTLIPSFGIPNQFV
jgi:hypothetical protein